MLEELGLRDLLLQHGVEHADVVADEQQRNHLARSILGGQVVAHVGLAARHRDAGVGLALGHGGIGRVVLAQRRALLALALVVLDRGGDADEVVALLGEHGGDAAGFAGEFIDRAVVLVDQRAIAAQLARGFVELHGGLEVALEALHGELHQLAVGVVGRVQRLRHALRRVAHAGHHLRAGAALGQHRNRQPHQHQHQGHQPNGGQRDLPRDRTVVGQGCCHGGCLLRVNTNAQSRLGRSALNLRPESCYIYSRIPLPIARTGGAGRLRLGAYC